MARITDHRLAADWIAQAPPYTEFTLHWRRSTDGGIRLTRYMCRDIPKVGRRCTDLDHGFEAFTLSHPNILDFWQHANVVCITFHGWVTNEPILQDAHISGFPVTVVTVTGERLENVTVLELTDCAVVLGMPGWKPFASYVRPAMWLEWDHIAWVQDAPLNNEETMI
jgi:hypothetical protein